MSTQFMKVNQFLYAHIFGNVYIFHHFCTKHVQNNTNSTHSFNQGMKSWSKNELICMHLWGGGVDFHVFIKYELGFCCYPSFYMYIFI